MESTGWNKDGFTGESHYTIAFDSFLKYTVLSPAVELLRVLFPHQMKAMGNGGILWVRTEETALPAGHQYNPHIIPAWDWSPSAKR